MTKRTHHLLGWLAVAHAVLVLGAALLLLRYNPVPSYLERLWVAVATLWFLWPFVLLLTPSRPFVRVALPLVAATVVALFWLRFYAMIAPIHLGLPWGVTLSPASMSKYFVAYWRGRADANKDISTGRLAVEVYGGPGDIVTPLHYLKERYGVEVKAVASCVVGERTLGHARGYNQVASAEVARRFGAQILDPQTAQPKMESSN
jgi:hypothetical protein